MLKISRSFSILISSSKPIAAKQAVALALLGLTAPFLTGISFTGSTESDNWTIRIEQRTRAAAEEIHGRKVIFVGGSNLIFGLRADSLSRRIGVPVVNYGLHAHIGADVISERASELINHGDIVVLATEAMHDPFNERPTAIRAQFLSHVAAEHRLFSVDRVRLRCRLALQMVRQVVRLLILREPRNWDVPLSPYALTAIDHDGSLRFPRPKSLGLSPGPPQAVRTNPDFANCMATRALLTLQKKCRQRHATLAVMPPFRLAASRADSSLLLEYERRWLTLATARGAVLLMGPGETLLAPRFGYDSEYHLNDLGVATMEPRLAAALIPLLESEPNLARHKN